MRFGSSDKLFSEMLEPLTPLLAEKCKDVILNIDANCGIFVEDGEPRAYLYEWTPRQGYPASSLQEYLFDSDVGQFFADLIDRRKGGMEYKPEWGVVTVMGTGNFPSEGESHEGSFKDQPIVIPQCEMSWCNNIAPLYIRLDEKSGIYRVADHYEMPLAVCHHDEDILKANARCVEDMKQITIRAPRYRHDIGSKFVEKELPLLKEWGYIE